MIFGTGIDIVEIQRVRRAYERWGERFTARILTAGEIDLLRGKRDIYPYLASRFAAKEAFLKALGTGFAKGVSWQDIEVRREKGQRPFFYVSGKASAIMKEIGVKNVHLSLSHERRFAVAQVVLES